MFRLLRITLWLLALSLGSLAARAADEPAPPSAPDIRELRADWWSYFGEAGDALPQRVETFLTQLQEVARAVPPEFQVAAADAVRLIGQNFAAYQTLSAAPLPASFVADPVKTAYRLAELDELARAQRRLGDELAADTERAAQQEQSKRDAEQALSAVKLNYREQPAGSVQRFMVALDIVLRRLSVESLSAQNRRLRASIKVLALEQAALREEFEQARDRVAVDAQDRARIEASLAAAERDAARVATERRAYELKHPPIPDSAGDDRTLQAIRALALLKFDLRESVADLTRSRAELELVLADLLAGTSAAQDIDGLLRVSNERYAEAKRRAELWEAWLNRERALTLQRVTEVEQAVTESLRERQRLVADNTRLLDQQLRERERLGLATALLERQRDVREGYVGKLRRGFLDWIESAWISASGFMGFTLFEVNETPVTPAGLLRVLVIFVFAVLLSRVIRSGLTRVAAKRDTLSRASVYGLNRVIHYFIIVIGFMVGLSSIGIEFTKFALFASALGVGIGFGLQNLISNFVAGLIILFEKSLKVGDFVDLQSGVAGEVQEINMRSTLIRTTDNIDIIVPNAEFVSGRVTNWTLREAFRRVHVPFGVAYGTDKDKVKQAVLEAAEKIPHTLAGQPNRKPDVWFVGFGDSALNFELVVWLTPEAVKRPGKVVADYLWAIHTALEKHAIEVPFPQRDIHLKSFYGLTGDAARSAAGGSAD